MCFERNRTDKLFEVLLKIFKVTDMEIYVGFSYAEIRIQLNVKGIVAELFKEYIL